MDDWEEYERTQALRAVAAKLRSDASFRELMLDPSTTGIVPVLVQTIKGKDNVCLLQAQEVRDLLRVLEAQDAARAAAREAVTLGIAKGLLSVPDDIDEGNDDIRKQVESNDDEALR